MSCATLFIYPVTVYLLVHHMNSFIKFVLLAIPFGPACNRHVWKRFSDASQYLVLHETCRLEFLYQGNFWNQLKEMFSPSALAGELMQLKLIVLLILCCLCPIIQYFPVVSNSESQITSCFLFCSPVY